MWLVTRHEEVIAILNDHQRFSSSLAYDNPVDFLGLTEEVREIIELIVPLTTPHLASADPPDHTRLRSAFVKGFTSSALARFEPTVKQIADQIIDRFVGNGQAEIVGQFASELAFQSILRFIGVPKADVTQIKRWYVDWMTLLLGHGPSENKVELAKSTSNLHRYIAELISERRKKPESDLISELVQENQFNRKQITLPKLVNILSHLIGAGTETTMTTIANCIYHLLVEGSQWQAIQDLPQLIPNVVEEALRCNQSLHGLLRMAVDDVEINGVRIPKGARVYVLNTYANLDPSMFSEPDVFNPHREKLKRHLAFGYGIHHCLGAALARLELRISIESLRDRLPELELVRITSMRAGYPIVENVKELHVRWALC